MSGLVSEEKILISGRRVRNLLRDNIGLRRREQIKYRLRDDVLEVYTNRYINDLRCVYFFTRRQLLDMFDVSPSIQSSVRRLRFYGDFLVLDLTNS